MSSVTQKILKQAGRLMPTGRAFKMTEGSNMERLFKALAVSKAQAYEDASALLYALIPNNPYFTEDDATDWERRLGMVSNPLTPFADRKAAILRKMAAPGLNPAKGHYLWIQQQLQDAGFAVYIHENIFATYPTGYTTVAPNSLYGNGNFKTNRHGQARHGQRLHGGYYNNLIVNSITQAGDIGFNLGGSFRSSFFVGGQTIGTYANVLATRETEFRQLILNLKQVQNVGMLFIHYI